ncbi:MAG: hypothetical protein L6277_15920 [Desulfobacterales bacterium]|nr:hypothetical protein [Desulfobacterales bacterium]
MGTWTGTAPVITLTGCSTEAISVSISKQCTNLISGTVPIAGYSIPVVGKYYPDIGTVSLSGTLHNFTTPPYYSFSITLSGIYIPGTPPSISVSSYMAYDYTGNIEDLLNKEYDTFFLTRQIQ